MKPSKATIVDEAYRNLAFAVVRLTVQDYIAALKTMDKIETATTYRKCTLRESKARDIANRMRTDCLTFFRHSWFQALYDIDPDVIIARLNLIASATTNESE